MNQNSNQTATQTAESEFGPIVVFGYDGIGTWPWTADMITTASMGRPEGIDPCDGPGDGTVYGHKTAK